MNRLLHIIRCIIDKTRASRHNMLIRRSSNNIWIICIYIRRLMIHVTDVDCNNLMTIFLVARTGRRLFKAFVPSGVAKKCVDTRTRSRVPAAPREILRNSRHGRPAGSAIRKTVRQALLKPNAPVTREGPRRSTGRRLSAPSRPERPWSPVDRSLQI